MPFVTTIVFEDRDQADWLQEKAKELGFLKSVGSGAKIDGSRSALLRAICEGELTLVRFQEFSGLEQLVTAQKEDARTNVPCPPINSSI